jgi:5-formyltetrahydrofolate cyclo-ligase
MRKKEARKLFMEKRDAITDSQQLKWDDLILIQFQSIEIPFISNVLSFYSIPEKKEVNSFTITEYLRFRNPSLQVAYPRMAIPHTRMDAVISHADEAFADNEFGITEPIGNGIIDPADIELVLVPLLAVDKRGHRVGYGKGYYDRFLADCDPQCLKIGLSYFEPIDALEDAAGYDIPLDLCITPQQVYVF